MKILAVAATLVGFLCCLEVALGYPAYAAKPQLPQAVFQGRAPFEVAHGYHQFSKNYPSATVDQQPDRRHHFSKKYPSATVVDEQLNSQKSILLTAWLMSSSKSVSFVCND